jgi:hypothetical protein
MSKPQGESHSTCFGRTVEFVPAVIPLGNGHFATRGAAEGTRSTKWGKGRK